MKKIDVRFHDRDVRMLMNMKGKTLDAFLHDPDAIRGYVDLSCDGEKFRLSNSRKLLDYFGSVESVGILSLSKHDGQYNESDLLTDVRVKRKIRKIYVVNENQRLYRNYEMIYSLWFTKAIIFDMEGNEQLSLEKGIWFTNDIAVKTGKNLIEKLASPSDEFASSWSGAFIGRNVREKLVIG